MTAPSKTLRGDLDIRKWDAKARCTIGGPIAIYIRELVKLGLWGSTRAAVVRSLVEEGIRNRIKEGILKPIDFSSSE